MFKIYIDSALDSAKNEWTREPDASSLKLQLWLMKEFFQKRLLKLRLFNASFYDWWRGFSPKRPASKCTIKHFLLT